VYVALKSTAATSREGAVTAIIRKQFTNVWRLPKEREIRHDKERATETVESRAAFQQFCHALLYRPLHLMAIENKKTE
jgi:hypothetical protein